MTTININQLTDWCNQYLEIEQFSDYAPNGLQIDAGVENINVLITGVTACDALIDEAIALKAQAIMVHHGYFWKGEDPRLIGMKGKRIRKLMQHGISLIGYHLPLDAHPDIGNNAQLGKILDLSDIQPLYPREKRSIGNIFTADNITPQDFCNKIEEKLQRQPLHIASGKTVLQKIGLCTGAGQDMIEQAKLMGCDAFISGEISERTTHTARELGIDYFACGHHATEICGIKKLGELIQDKFNINVEFINIDNPV
ncbi:MAG: Nif3-like dinuclear metal center hexameric protein [Moraxellaceae bacterium]|nr:Nif3-like dinuclear metal center hexameric protein [Moraxellaceae bacterium]